MTMSREAKMDHKIQLDTAIYSPSGMTGTTFARPDRRGEYMTPAEYKHHRMHRGQQVEAREGWAASRATRRKITRK